MVDINSVTKEVIQEFGEYILTKIPTLNVSYEFPSANQALVLPSMTITQVGGAPFIPEMNPYVLSQGTLVTHKKDIRYVVGSYEFNLQVDLWCRTKEERNEYYQKFFKAMTSQFPVLGLTLTLENYYSSVCRYNMTSFLKEDAEISSQTREWRVKITIIADCLAIFEKSEFIIESIESQTEIPNGTLEKQNL